jgi:hypothetical protein
MIQNLSLRQKPAIWTIYSKFYREEEVMDKTRQKIIKQVADRIISLEITPDEARILNSDKGWYFGGLAYHLTDKELSQAMQLAKKMGS